MVLFSQGFAGVLQLVRGNSAQDPGSEGASRFRFTTLVCSKLCGVSCPVAVSWTLRSASANSQAGARPKRDAEGTFSLHLTPGSEATPGSTGHCTRRHCRLTAPFDCSHRPRWLESAKSPPASHLLLAGMEDAAWSACVTPGSQERLSPALLVAMSLHDPPQVQSVRATNVCV